MIKKIHYSWVILGACFCLFLLSYGILFTTEGFFTIPLTEELGFTMAQATNIIMIRSVAVTAATLASGFLIHLIGTRRLLFIMGVTLTLAFAVASQAQTLNVFYLLAIPQGFAVGVIVVPTATLAEAWFHQKRGTALGIMYIGTGVGGVLFSPLIPYVIGHMGIHATYRLLAVVIGVMYFIIVVIVRNSPEDIGLKPYGYLPGASGDDEDGDGASGTTLTGRNCTLQEAMKYPSFYIIAIVVAITIGVQGVYASQAPVIITMGVSNSQIAGFAISTLSLCSMVGSPLFGIIMDRMGTRRGNIYIFTLLALAAVSLLLVGPGMAFMAFGFGIFGGLSDSANAIPVPIWISEAFGSKGFAGIMSVLSFLGSLAASVGIYLSGRDVERHGNFNMTLITIAAGFVICMVLMELLYRSYKKRSNTK